MSNTRYTTQGGERWDTIAFFAYQDAQKVSVLIEANPLLPIYDQFPRGVEVNIPILPESQANQVLPPWKRTQAQAQPNYEPTPVLPEIVRSAPVLPFGFISESDRKPPIFAWTGIVSLVNSLTGKYRIQGVANAWNGPLFYAAPQREMVLTVGLGNGSDFTVTFDYESNIADLATTTPASSTTTTLNRNDSTTLAGVGWDQIKAYITGSLIDGFLQIELEKVGLHTSSTLKLFGDNAVNIELECFFRNKAGDGNSDTQSFGLAERYDAQALAISASFESSATSVSLGQDIYIASAVVISWGNGLKQYTYANPGSVVLTTTYTSGQGRDWGIYTDAANVKNISYASSKLAGILDFSETTNFSANVSFNNNTQLEGVYAGSSTLNVASFLGQSCDIQGTLDMRGYADISGSFRVQSNKIEVILFESNVSQVLIMDMQNNDMGELDLSGFAQAMSLNNARINLQNNNFTSAKVDEFLVTLDGITVSGFTGRTVNVSGTGMGAPSATGLAAVASLFTKGIIVTHN